MDAIPNTRVLREQSTAATVGPLLMAGMFGLAWTVDSEKACSPPTWTMEGSTTTFVRQHFKMQKKSDFVLKTSLAEKLWGIRQRIVAAGETRPAEDVLRELFEARKNA